MYLENTTFMKERPLGQLLASMAVPMVLSMLVSSLYNIVDSYFVAKISEDAMTALSLVYPIQNFINAAAIGFGVGLNAVIAFELGRSSRSNADQAATQGILLSAVHGIVLTILTCIILVPFLRMFTDRAAVLNLSLTYGYPVVLFSVIVNVELAFEKIFQAVGRMKVSMASMLIGCLTNIALDPCLIFGLGPFSSHGILGAAIATDIGQLVTLSCYLIVYFVKPIPVKMKRSCINPNRQIIYRLYRIGIPATLNLALPSVMISVLNAILASFSSVYVLVLGAYYKLQNFLYLTSNGIIQGMRPLMSYNYGAREYKRVRRLFRMVLLLCVGIMLLGTILCLVIPDELIGLFTSRTSTIAAGRQALHIISAGFTVSAVSVVCSGSLEALGKGGSSLLISLCRYILILLPAAFLLSRYLGPSGVWHAFWISESFTALAAFYIYRHSAHLNGK
ncbi:MAG: MATE family efflux transporter [Oscillospiraceae bacterium]|nr:MATE family efflux transporter [Oscillospiraceae bacterium]